MNYDMMKAAVTSKGKGTFRTIAYESQLKTKKEFRELNVVKFTTMPVRLGVVYDNTAAVQMKRANGELPATNQGHNGKKWLEYPYFLTNRTEDKVYLQMIPRAGSKPKTVYLINGSVVSEAQARAVCIASNFDKPTPNCMTISLDKIHRID